MNGKTIKFMEYDLTLGAHGHYLYALRRARFYKMGLRETFSLTRPAWILEYNKDE